MKKLLSLLLTAVLCLSLCAVACADEISTEELTVELDETYQEVALGEDYAVTYIPSDWLISEAEYADENGELLGAFTNADGTALILATYAESETPTSYEEVYAQSTEAGLNCSLIVVNGWEYICINSADEENVTIMANMLLDEEGTAALAFTFTFAIADAEAMETVFNQVLGGLAFVEEEAAE